MVSPFIKFKNASKETIDASDELVEEIRRALMQAGQRLAKHIKREAKESELESRLRHIEKFGPILVETLARITGSGAERKKRAEEGLLKILGRDTKNTEKELREAEDQLNQQNDRLGVPKKKGDEEDDVEDAAYDPDADTDEDRTSASEDDTAASKATKKKASTKKSAQQKKRQSLPAANQKPPKPRLLLRKVRRSEVRLTQRRGS